MKNDRVCQWNFMTQDSSVLSQSKNRQPVEAQQPRQGKGHFYRRCVPGSVHSGIHRKEPFPHT